MRVLGANLRTDVTRSLAVVAIVLALIAAPSAQAIPTTHFGASKASSARAVYVAQNGGLAAPCTKTRPCATITRALQRARSGDVIFVTPGQYAQPTIALPAVKHVTIWGLPTQTAQVIIDGDIAIQRGRVILANLQIEGAVSILPEASGSMLLANAARGFNIYGAHDILIRRNRFDGRGEVAQNIIWDQPAGHQPMNWRIIGNTFANFYNASDPSAHSEALYVGFSERGLIERNTFSNNGSTAHLFFTWFGTKADPATTYPRDICVRSNVFGRTHTAFTAIAFREEIPSAARIRIDPSNRGASTTSRAFNGRC